MRINKELREYVSRNIIDLTSSSRKLGDVYRLMFRDNNLNIAETEENYRVRKYSFAEIRSYIEKAADELYSAIGASHGFVALEMENCVEWIVAFWAVLKSGNKPFLVNCRHTISLIPGTEPDPSSSRRSTPGSTPFCPSAAGLIIAAEVVKDLTSFDPANR